jgi:hypothetical protein
MHVSVVCARVCISPHPPLELCICPYIYVHIYPSTYSCTTIHPSIHMSPTPQPIQLVASISYFTHTCNQSCKKFQPSTHPSINPTNLSYFHPYIHSSSDLLFYLPIYLSPFYFLHIHSSVSLMPDSCWFLIWLTLQPWSWRRYVPLKCQLTFTRLQGVISHKTELFIATAVRTSDPTYFYTFI